MKKKYQVKEIKIRSHFEAYFLIDFMIVLYVKVQLT